MSENYNDIIPDFWISIQSATRCLGKACYRISSGGPFFHYLGLSATGALCTFTCVLSGSTLLGSYNKFLISTQLLAEGTIDMVEGFKPHTCKS